MNLKNYDSDIPEGHVSQETRVFYPNDVKLRRYGFKILSRLSGQEPRWFKQGKAYTETEALKEIDREPAELEKP